MSYTSIPNQPLIFSSQLPEQCEGCNSGYAQLVDFNDQLFAQFECSPCGTPMFSDGSAVFEFGGATTNGFNLTKTNTNQTWAAYWEFAQYMQYDVIKVVVQVDSIQGILSVQDQYSSFQINTPGQHTLYFPNYYFNVPTYTIGFGGTNAFTAFQGECTLVSVEGIPAGGIFVGLVDAVTLAPIFPIFPTITRVDNVITIGFDMSNYEVEAGCYRLAIADYCTNTCGQFFIENPFFNCLRSVVPDWSDESVQVGAVVNFNCPSVTLISPDDTSSAILQSSTQLCEGITYNYTINVTDNNLDGILEFRVSNLPSCSYIETIPQSVGILTGTITPTCSGNLEIWLTADTGSASVDISFVQIRANQEDAIYDKYSDLITIGDYSDPCRFFKIEGCNGENQFGLTFYGSSFLPSIRLEGRRFQAQYDTDTDLFRYASGRWSASYVDRKKKLSYYFGRLPEYVFDFLSIVFYFDNCYVNGVLHFPAEDEFPTIEYETADDLGAFTIELYKKNDLVRKTICIGVDADCLPSILDNNTEPFILTQDNERIVTENLINLYQE